MGVASEEEGFYAVGVTIVVWGVNGEALIE